MHTYTTLHCTTHAYSEHTYNAPRVLGLLHTHDEHIVNTPSTPDTNWSRGWQVCMLAGLAWLVSQTGSSHEYIRNTHYVYMMCILMGATVISWIHDKKPLRRRHAHDSCAGVMSSMNHVHDGVPSVCMTPCA